MACMWPLVLPDWVLADGRRNAEIAVFRRLDEALDSSWNVFYSRPWWGISPKGGELDGEADFILVHPDHGLLFLEVKGGAIAYDPTTDQWTSRDRNGIRHKIKDPVKQATTCKHQFLGRLKATQGWPSAFIRFRHGVIFPDCESPPISGLSVGQYEKRLFCCMQEFEYALDKWIHGRMIGHPTSSGHAEQGPGLDGVEIVKSLVADPVSFKVLVGREVLGEIDAMETLLTGAQLALISIIDSAPRALVEGGAGTGKTVLAMEMAARYELTGRTILFCCRSGPLSQHVATNEPVSKCDRDDIRRSRPLSGIDGRACEISFPRPLGCRYS
ncbi:NERD domain-containing protein [Undibacterium arcticum]|uniref:nuclease-related domain-containing protein n=1 Tax=Undibacterium arcticum TaxID=1762892 RepID=UPI00361251CC